MTKASARLRSHLTTREEGKIIAPRKTPATPPGAIHNLAMHIYRGRLKALWNDQWHKHDQWPSSERAWIEYNKHAGYDDPVTLALASATEVNKYMEVVRRMNDGT